MAMMRIRVQQRRIWADGVNRPHVEAETRRILVDKFWRFL